MATTATRNGNTLYLEASGGATTIDALTAKNVILFGVVLTVDGSGDTLTLLDVSTQVTKIALSAPASTTQFWDLSSCPVLFPNGIRATLGDSGSKATLIIKASGA